MGTIVAIGGGELRYHETLAIDKEIVKLTGKVKPKALFIPTASHDAKSYMTVFKNIYGQQLNCDVSVLQLVDCLIDQEAIEQQILQADLIYVGGGDTAFMLDLWKQLHVDQYLIKAYKQGTILSGLSAGAICWFDYGWSDSQSFITPDDWTYTLVKGLGLIKGIVCVHYDKEGRDSFDSFIKTQSTIGYGIENNVAYVLHDNKAYVIKSDEGKQAYQIKQTSWHIL
ncbi:MAG TPA: peptidase E [Firmicutes bacterium]|nr:peptidase E [Bacillota bacterium]